MAAGLCGLARSVNAENKFVRCIADSDRHGLWSLAAVGSSSEYELAINSGITEIVRLQSVKHINYMPVELSTRRGPLSSLRLFVQPQCVQYAATLQVKAVGLNFRDVLNVLGMYPGDPGPPGSDCAGVMLPTGTAQTSDVFGLALGCLRSYTAADPRLVTGIPPDWSYTEVSCMPTVWATVWLGLEGLGGRAAASGVLVHAATGGIGLVAMQWAHRAGAVQLFGTAGRAAKRSYLRQLDAPLVSTSRACALFQAEMDSLLGCCGMELSTVLNSLSHDCYIPSGAALLEHAGRFLEIGKRGIWTRVQMPKAVRYSILAVDAMTEMDPRWQGCVLEILSSSAGNHELNPLPMHVHGLELEVTQAFRFLQRADHIGKVVVQSCSCSSWHDSLRHQSTRFVISGGMGGLGLLAGQWLVQLNAGQLVLLSRSGRTTGGADYLWRELSYCDGGSNAFFSVELCDIGIDQEVSRVTSHEAKQLGVVHAAGVLADASLMDQTQAGLCRVWTPKASAAWSLHQSTISVTTSMFVLFSSVVSILGGIGLANYAAANASLAGLARFRSQRGLSASCVQWGAWAGAGMAARSGVLGKLQSQGMAAVTVAQGLHALEIAANGSVGSVVAMAPVLWPRLLKSKRTVPAFLKAFVVHDLRHEEACSVTASNFVTNLSEQSHRALQLAIEALVLLKVQETAGVTVTVRDPLMQSGVDSLAATELSNSLQHELGTAVKLPSTLVFDYPTPFTMTEFMVGQLTHLLSVPQSTAQVSSSHADQIMYPRSTRNPQVSMSVAAKFLRSPLGVSDSTTTWEAMGCAYNSVQHIPSQRFDCAQAVTAFSKFDVDQGHFLSDIELFEPAMFRMHTTEVRSTDPSHRVLLEVALETLTRAQYTKDSLTDTDTGVFLGIANVGDWPLVRRDKPQIPSVFDAHGSDGGAAAGRVSYLFGLKGPCLSVNTACSSSLVALDVSTKQLELGRCSRALVAGVCLHLHPSSFAAFCVLHALSPNAMCKTFDSRADGYGRSEACGGVLVEQQLTATAQVCATDLNQDGRSASFMAPNGLAQQRLIQHAMQLVGAPVGTVEAHGTGTTLRGMYQFLVTDYNASDTD